MALVFINQCKVCQTAVEYYQRGNILDVVASNFDRDIGLSYQCGGCDARYTTLIFRENPSLTMHEIHLPDEDSKSTVCGIPWEEPDLSDGAGIKMCLHCRDRFKN